MISNLDLAGVRAINGLAGQRVWLDTLGIFGAKHLIVFMAALVLAYVVAAWKTSHFEGRVENAWHIGWTVVIAFAAESVIGFLWFRLRPFAALEDVSLLIAKSPLDPSFPSGHATVSFALAFGMFLHNRKWGGWMIALALIVSLSRVYVGVHYPSDLAGGIIVAFVAAIITAPFKRRIEPYLDLFAVFRKFKRRA